MEPIAKAIIEDREKQLQHEALGRASPFWDPGIPQAIVESKMYTMDVEPGDFGVETCANGDVRIKLGTVMPFDIPADTAVKFAVLLLSKAGWKVTIKDRVITSVQR